MSCKLFSFLFGTSEETKPTDTTTVKPQKLQQTINTQVVNAATALAKYAKDQRLQLAPRIVATYDYVDENGAFLYQVVRYVPKDFKYRRKDSEGKWVYNLKDTPAVVYNLPAVIQANEVLIAEGEKDANSLIDLGFAATTNHGGVGKDAWKTEYNDWFKDADVLLIPDNDYPGRKHARTVATNLIDVAGQVRFLFLPDVEQRGDISEWIAKKREAGLDNDAIRGALLQLIEQEALPAEEVLSQPPEEPPSTTQRMLNWPGVFSPPKISALINMRPLLDAQAAPDDKLEFEPFIIHSPGRLRLAPAEETWQPSIPLSQPHSARSVQRQRAATDNENETSLDDILNNMLTRPDSSGNPLAFAAKPVSDASFHDFAYYEYMLPPDGSYLPDGLDLTGIGAAEQQEIETFVRMVADIIYQNVVLHFTTDAYVPAGYGYGGSVPRDKTLRDEYVSNLLFNNFFMVYTTSDLYAFYRSLDDSRTVPYPHDDAQYGTYPELLVKVYFSDWFSDAIRAHLPYYEYGELMSDNLFTDTVWRQATDKIKADFLKDFSNPFKQSDPEYESYSFKPYPAGSVNFGLRVNYRQTWNDMGTQAGPIVRTLPLGPSQTEKISTKFIRHRTMSRSQESLVETERDRESTETTTDSSDIVREAAESTNWYAEASASASGFGFSASVKAGGGGESSSSSKDAKSHLNETMEKTASRMRSETKAVISTSRETTFEETRATEITNPNEELAITYAYRRLLRQYKIITEMAEVDSVIFVAEHIPKPSEITADWIRRYDSIIARVLLDPSLGEDLALIRSTTPEPDTSDDDTDPIKQIMSEATSALGQYKSTSGTLPDIFRTPQESYSKTIEQKQERSRREQQRLQREQRVREHIKHNILHYCRAIWSAEDPDIRQQRYSEIRVPVNWRAVTAGGGSNGYFEAVLENQDRDIRPLSEIINPAGPIGFACNYAIYYLKSNAALVNLNSAISQLRSHYVLHRVNITPSENNQGNAQVIQLAFKHVTYQDFELELKTMDNTTKLVMRSSAGESAREFTADNLGKPFDSFAGILGLRLMIDSETGTMPSPGDKWFVNIETTEFLEDPELRQLKWDKALPPIDSEAGLFTETVLAEMAEHLPEVADRLRAEAIGQGLPEDTQLSWAELSNETRVFIRGQYHRYLLIRRYTRMFPVDSNNLLLDLELGKTPALEEFKRLHRYVDVLKAVEEQQRLDLENERREKLLEEERLGDPDIEKVTVIGTASELEPVVNVDINEED